ncbi:Crp/Fnr family transcriptional regulator [Caulobacter mirabilis]|uniref:Crp/Fnr family transcriptional regulator n=1 Tax=Caulobacter mirabilis TaxID=69666 RepID=UPI0012376CB2|nr:helix-turn-helix domain-containing protein [Caulobacter mirabilis]
MRALAAAYPTLYPRVIERIGVRMRDLIGGNLAASLHRPEGRLAYLLAVSARDRASQGDGPVELPLTQERLAAMGLGGRQRVARLLRALAGRGLVECRYGCVRIPSLRALEAFALP